MDYNSYLEAQKRYPRTISNDYTLPADLRRIFTSGFMRAVADEKALFLFESREGFTKLRFRLLDPSAMLRPPEGAIAAFLTYRENRRPEIEADWLLVRGFKKTKTLRRHTAVDIKGPLTLDGLEHVSADEAYFMLGEHFSAIEADLPRRDIFEGALCIRSADGKLNGVIHLGHRPVLAVAPEARGLGVGRRLYLAYAATKVRDGRKPVFHAWISPDNAGSLAMFKSLGFIADNVKTDCYVWD